MAIKGLSEIVRLPRLGKIRLGVKVQGQEKEYPKRVNYFVCPENVRAIYGEKPTVLPISFPSSDPEVIAPQYYKKYGKTYDLICRGNGELARAKIDLCTGAHVDRNTSPENWEYREITCEGEECPEYQAGNCKRCMTLVFMLHELPGLGVYQLDTSNRHSIINANSIIFLLDRITSGRFGMVPLKMLLLKEERHTPEGKKNIECLVFNKDDIKPMDLLKGAAGSNLLVEGIDENEAPDDLYPPRVQETADEPGPRVVEGQGRIVDSKPAGAAAPSAPLASTPSQTKSRTRKSKSEAAPPANATSANAPLLSPEVLTAWLTLRTLQTDLKVDDNMLRAGFRKEYPTVEIPKSALSDSPPGWATLPMINSLIARLEKYQDSIMNVKEFSEHLGEKAQAAAQQILATEHKEQPDELDELMDK